MCKILIIPKVTKETSEKAIQFMKAAKSPLSEYNNDGFGYAGMNSSGEFFGEKWVRNVHAFEKREGDSISFDKLAELEGFVSKPSKSLYSSFNTGKLSLDEMIKTSNCLVAHARKKTNGDEVIENTHPFVSENTVLIHNGMIRNYDTDFKHHEDKCQSTCDSEMALHEYDHLEVNKNVKKVQKLANSIVGYYAFAFMSTDKNGKPILDIMKHTNAWLYVCFVKELDSYVFCTGDDTIKKTIEKLKWNEPVISQVNDGVHFRFDIITGELINKSTFKCGPNHKPTNWRDSKNTTNATKNMGNYTDKKSQPPTRTSPYIVTTLEKLEDEVWDRLEYDPKQELGYDPKTKKYYEIKDIDPEEHEFLKNMVKTS